MTRAIRVYIADRPAGVLEDEGAGISRFTYDDSYDGPNISVRMPRSGPEASYVGRDVTNWFAGLLPDEDDTRFAMAQAASADSLDLFSLLDRYGMDCPGAIQAFPAGAPQDPDRLTGSTVPISRQAIAVRLKSVSSSAASWEMPDEAWSLGGTQGKIALRLTGTGWERCIGRAATTHILKPGVTHLAAQAVDEHVSMLMAGRAGLPVARTWVESFDGVDAIVVERYDRIWDGQQVVRFHQEDMCQAFGIHPQRKYTSDGGPSSNAIMGLLAQDRMHDSRRQFIQSLCLNYLIGATDGHAKNYSLLHLRGDDFILAPLYDVASALPYFASNHVIYRTALSIGGENRIGWMRKGPLERFDRANGLDPGTMRHNMLDIAWKLHDGMHDVLDRTADELPGSAPARLLSRLGPRLRRLVEGTIDNVDSSGASFAPVEICGDE